MYQFDPQQLCPYNASAPLSCSAAQRQMIVGGQACQWGENVDATNLFTTSWPDLTAVAERLWSPKAPQGGLDLLDGRMHRLRVHRCRLLARGVPVGPMAAVYMPDPSHASFHTWRQYQWCPADASFWADDGRLPRLDAESESWASRRAGAVRAAEVRRPFDP